MAIKKVFISHCWDYSDDYEKLKKWVDNTPRITIYDYSISAEKKLTGLTTAQLKVAITEQIRQCSVFVVPTAIYSSCSDWVKFEIETAVALKKPILGVNPWAQQHYSQAVTSNANKIVGWNEKSVQSAIKELAK
ncbi:MAG: hypothetical protein E7Z89_00720 [Cyanobacteria bacterium SIG28]|nr:hypothetical protein [Cyanobacteria bacterium SIG28]